MLTPSPTRILSVPQRFNQQSVEGITSVFHTARAHYPQLECKSQSCKDIPALYAKAATIQNADVWNLAMTEHG